MLLLKLDLLLKYWIKEKGLVVESAENTFKDTLTRDEYLVLVRKDMLNKISQSDKEKLDMFREKAASLGPSSGWGLRLASWNKDLNNLLLDTTAAVSFSLPARVYK
ncbi:hypothetical protein Hanom_Chr07g00613251 [Helianthus anomalus]